MTAGHGWEPDSSTEDRTERAPAVALALALAAMAAVGAGFALQQLLERRLTKPEVARLKFYRYLRERGHLES